MSNITEKPNIIVDICSAFNGDHVNCPLPKNPKPSSLRKGNLGRALTRWENGTELPPELFVFEDWDRLSRMDFGCNYILLQRLSNLGIKMVSAFDHILNPL